MKISQWEKEQYELYLAFGENEIMKAFFPLEEKKDIITFVKESRINEVAHYLNERPGSEVFNDPERAKRVIDALLNGLEVFIQPDAVKERYFNGEYGERVYDDILIRQGKYTVECDAEGEMKRVISFEVTDGPEIGKIIKPMYVFPRDMEGLRELE